MVKRRSDVLIGERRTFFISSGILGGVREIVLKILQTEERR